MTLCFMSLATLKHAILEKKFSVFLISLLKIEVRIVVPCGGSYLIRTSFC